MIRHSGWTCEWQKGTHRNGLAVLARDPYRLELREESPEPFFISTLVSGPIRLRFVSFWARTPLFVGDWGGTRVAKVNMEIVSMMRRTADFGSWEKRNGAQFGDTTGAAKGRLR